MAILARESPAATWRDPPPNLVEISPRLVTSGQPSRVWEPEGPWKSYIRDILRSNNVGFDPF
jgi:hypothetical protein